MLGNEPAENLVTWVYEEGSYVPVAKLQNGERYTIISDYMGRPVEAYDSYGTVVWQADYDIYGDLRNRKGIRDFIPFRQLGQYEDDETHLYYNRFRYYDPRIGNYISQDPIRLMGNNPTLYGYVGDCNMWADVFGLDCSSDAAILRRNMQAENIMEPDYKNSAHHIIMSNSNDYRMEELRDKMSKLGFDINDAENGVYLPTSSKIKTKSGTTAIAHSKIHTNTYKQNVYDRLKDINTTEEFGNELKKISSEIRAGTFNF